MFIKNTLRTDGQSDEAPYRDDSAHVIISVGYLNAKRRIRLLEENIPNVQSSVHFGGEVDSRSSRAPTCVCQIVLKEKEL